MDKEMDDLTSNQDNRLRRYNVPKQTVEFRSPNYGNAISEERLWWRGVFKRKNNDTKCYPYFVKYEGCGICLKVCPINRFGYKECMKAYKKDGTILGKSKKTIKETTSWNK